ANVLEPSSSNCLRPATRISKNSSRLLEEMQRKRSRSSSGTDSSKACASTRRLNSRKESSRLKQRPGDLRSGASMAQVPHTPGPYARGDGRSTPLLYYIRYGPVQTPP